MNMDHEEYIQTMKEVFDNFEEYDSRLELAHVREYVADLIWYEGVKDSGNVQTNYERLRDRVEAILEKLDFPGVLDWRPE